MLRKFFALLVFLFLLGNLGARKKPLDDLGQAIAIAIVTAFLPDLAYSANSSRGKLGLNFAIEPTYRPADSSFYHRLSLNYHIRDDDTFRAYYAPFYKINSDWHFGPRAGAYQFIDSPTGGFSVGLTLTYLTSQAFCSGIDFTYAADLGQNNIDHVFYLGYHGRALGFTEPFWSEGFDSSCFEDD